MSDLAACPAERPIFIVGNPRSGTTLLTFILSSHPRIHIPGETGFLPRLIDHNQQMLSQTQVSEVLKKIARLNREWGSLVENEDEFYDALPSKSLRCVLDRLYYRQTRAFNAERWGDKTPSYVRFIPQINQIFPTAQFIHVIRDGRDSALSAQQKWGSQRWYMDNYYLLKNWQRHVQAGLQAGRDLDAGRYFEISYETLVQYPHETIEQVCEFLGEDFHPDLLDHTKLAQAVIGPDGHTEVRQPINTNSVGRWQQEMTVFDRKMANRLIGETLEAMGYTLADVSPLTNGERLKLFLLWFRYTLIAALRWVLYRFGLLTLNRGKRQKDN